MLQIKDTLVSLDLAERFFCCNLEKCQGVCCLDGDAGAPVTEEEVKHIEKVLPLVRERMFPASVRAVDEGGLSYLDPEGDLVLQLQDSGACVFAVLDDKGCWSCLLEQAYNEGLSDFRKPASCHLYPVRVKKYPTFTAVNYHRWKICRCAEALGREKGLRAYKFLEKPLRNYFGDEWFDELQLTIEEYLRQYGQ